MSGGIYLIQSDDSLVELTEQPYDSEDLLQQLLAKYPSLLAGSQMDTAKPRRWLLVCREAALPSEDGGGDRWSVDHLFLDQDAVPTLVEVKRSSDSRIRREVVGQMLDYAANAVVYWPVEEIRAKFDGHCAKLGKDPEVELAVFLSGEGTAEKFWAMVKTNLQAGCIRMVFVADEIPGELRRIVEFLNQQMKSAEVLAVEIKQFVGSGLKTLVPRVMGQTAEAERSKSASRSSRQWDESTFLAALADSREPTGVPVAKVICDWAKKRVPQVWWGRGAQMGSFTPIVHHGEDPRDGKTWTAIFVVWTYGTLEVYFQYLKNKKAFGDEAKRLELLDRLNRIPGISLPRDCIDRRPGIPLTALTSPSALKQFLGTFDWVVEEILKSDKSNSPRPNEE